MHTILATFEEYGDTLSYFIVPLELDLAEIVHSQGDDDEIRTYACHLDADWADKEYAVEDALDFLGQIHAIDAKNRSRL